MNNIHIIHASRERHSQAEKTYDKWVKQLKLGDSYTIAIESDQYLDYKNLPCLVVGGGTAIIAFNEATYLLHEAWKTNDIIIALSDDFPNPCDLELIRNSCEPDKLLKTFDGIQNWIVTLPIMGVGYYRHKGYIYPPQYKHMFADTHITHEAEISNTLTIRNDIVISHEHYSIGGSAKDSLNARNDKTFEQGKAEYIKWVNGKLLPQSKEGEGLMNWLKQNTCY